MCADFTSCALAQIANGAVSVMPRPVSMRIRSPHSCSARRSSLSQTGWARPAPEKKNILTRLKKVLRSAGSTSSALAISSNPFGTLK